MAPEARKELKCPTLPEIAKKKAREEELEMHRQFENYCNYHEIPRIHSRTDKKATTAKGTPDFVLLYGEKCCAIELKGPGGSLTPEQENVISFWMCKGVRCLVATTLQEAIDFARTCLSLHSAA